MCKRYVVLHIHLQLLPSIVCGSDMDPMHQTKLMRMAMMTTVMIDDYYDTTGKTLIICGQGKFLGPDDPFHPFPDLNHVGGDQCKKKPSKGRKAGP